MSSVSVVIPCYNAGRFLRETLDSILAQTRKPLEVIVVDDGSTDGSAAVADSFGPPVRVMRQPNQGESVARNHGLHEAKGDWVAFLDADDVWTPRKLELQLAGVVGRDDVVCSHTGFSLFGSRSEVPAPPPDVLAGCYEVDSLLLTPLVNTSTAMVRRQVPTRFPTWTRHAEDMLFFTELSLHGFFTYVPEPLAGYRMHAAQQTKRKDSSVQNLQSRFRWLELNADQLGAVRVAVIEARLRQQLVEWLDLARWSRNWDRYWNLRRYAASLDWKGTAPAVLRERPYPRFVYAAKDLVDSCLGRWGRKAGRVQPPMA